MIMYAEALTALLQYAINNSYTPAQARSATKQQVATILSVDVDDPRWSGGNIGMFTNLCENVARALQAEINEADYIIFKNAVRAVFPNATFTANKRHRVVRTLVDGKDIEPQTP